MKKIALFSFSKSSLKQNIIEKDLKFNDQVFNDIDLLVFEHSSLALAVASKLSCQLNIEIFCHVDQIQVDSFRCQTFSGKSRSIYSIKEGIRYIFILSKSFKIDEFIGFNKKIEVEIEASNQKGILIQSQINNSAIALNDAKIVVGAGRGMKDPGNWGIIEELGVKLGAALACSKPVSDLNWRPHHEHVGQTGVKISPKLYIACGISGAIQHLAGVNGSETIIVINSDPEAPFIQNADYAVIGDLFTVVPELLKIIN
jgi:electron transfer flavoprotein alpha subunit